MRRVYRNVVLQGGRRWAGKTLTKVSPQYTSKKCIVCGKTTTELKLSDRVFVSPECGWEAKQTGTTTPP